jgi:hypothetical protein
MKIDQSVYHLILFLALLASLTLIILTGHDNSPLLHELAGGLFGGAIGGSAVGSIPALSNFLSGPGGGAKQGGFIRPAYLIALLFVASLAAACASLQQAATTNPVATTCASASVAIKTLTVARRAGVLSLADASAVNQSIAVVSPVCDSPTEPTASGAVLSSLVSATATLQGIAARYPTTH